MENIERPLFVFYQKENKLYQVQLTEDDTDIVWTVIQDLHGGRIKVMEEAFCDIRIR